ncbi:MAG: ABC transporter permease [Lachnospiraceae bacterium]|nr:ABC transporter permease [Lachnospiraceae bacterium]
MTFRDVIKKNFLGDLERYLSYFLSGVFCVAMFFTYSTLILLDEITKSVDTYPMDFLMITTCFITMIFSIFFINYSHGNFVRNKKKELATYMVLGMDEKDGVKLLAVQTAIIAFASIIVGMITGVLFSRLFQLIALRIVDIDSLDFRLSGYNFLVTFLVFALIYAICFAGSVIKLRKSDISNILKDKRIKEGKEFKTHTIVLFIIGIVLLAFSLIFLYFVAGDVTINYKPWVVITFLSTGYVGLFLIIRYGICCMIHFQKKRKSYYNNMLSVTGMDYKFSQNTKIIMILSLLASMIVLLVGSPIALLKISTDIAEDSSEDIEYLVQADADSEAFTSIADKENILSDEVMDISYVTNAEGKIAPVVKASDYNQKYGTDFAPENGCVQIITISWVPGNNGYAVGKNIEFFSGEKSFTFTVDAFVKGDFECVNVFNACIVCVISDEDYTSMSDEFIHGRLHKIDIGNNWKDSEDTFNELKAAIGEDGVVNARISQYKTLIHGYSMFLFTSCSMCLMFFVSTGFVLYFKQYNDIEDDKKQYVQLFKMGISDKMIQSSIKKKMAVVYFTPLFGSVMGLAIMYYLSSLFGGGNIVTGFMSKGIIGLILYAGSQILFYIILKTKYIRDVVH